MQKELQEQLKKLLKCSDKNCQEGHYPLGMNEDGEIEWGGCPNCVVGSDYLPRVDPYKLKSFIDQNFIGKKEVREKIENIKCDYPKSSSQKEHQINIEIIERTVNQIREELLKQTK